MHWRDPERNVRRFFTIDDLVAVRVEDREVAAIVDTIPRRLVDHPAFAGVRVDHVDGLAAPGDYLEGLRDVIGDRLLFVEKIVALGEQCPRTGRSTAQPATNRSPRPNMPSSTRPQRRR